MNESVHLGGLGRLGAVSLFMFACQGRVPPAPTLSHDANVREVPAPAASPSGGPVPAPSGSPEASTYVELDTAEIANCMTFTARTIDPNAPIIKVELDAKVFTGLGGCGCTSMKLRFLALQRFSAGRGELRWAERAHDTFDSRKTHVTLDLGSRASYESTPKITVRIGCAGPE